MGLFLAPFPRFLSAAVSFCLDLPPFIDTAEPLLIIYYLPFGEARLIRFIPIFICRCLCLVRPFRSLFPHRRLILFGSAFLAEDCFSCTMQAIAMLSHEYMPSVTMFPRMHRTSKPALNVYRYIRPWQIESTCPFVINTSFSRLLKGKRWFAAYG